MCACAREWANDRFRYSRFLAPSISISHIFYFFLLIRFAIVSVATFCCELKYRISWLFLIIHFDTVSTKLVTSVEWILKNWLFNHFDTFSFEWRRINFGFRRNGFLCFNSKRVMFFNLRWILNLYFLLRNVSL